MRNDHLPRIVGLALVGVFLSAAAGAAAASEQLPRYYQVLTSLPQRVRDAERPLGRDLFVATKLTSKPGPAMKVTRFELVGVTAIPVAELQAKADAKAGAALTPEQIDAVSEEIAKQYRAKGFPLAMAALTGVQGGVARIQVYEGKLAKVRVEGSHGYAEEAVKQPFLDLPRGKPLTAAELEMAARNLDDYPGLDVKIQALPAKTAGETDLVVKVVERRVSGGAGMDNNGFESIGRQRYRVEMQWNSPSGWGDQVGLSLMNTDMGGLQYARLDYSMPIDGNTRAELSYAASRFQSEGLEDVLLGPYTALGKTSDMRVGVLNVGQRDRGYTRLTEYYFQRLEGRNWVSGAPVVIAPPYDASGIAIFGISWFSSNRGADGNGVTSRISFESNGRHNDGTEPDALLGQLRFTVDNLSGGNVRAYTRLRGVLTAGPAPLLKRFQLGGPDSVRAYDYAMREGDGGADATAELRIGSTRAGGARSEFLMFVDAGYMATDGDTTTPTGSGETLLGGVGLGYRYSAPGFEFRLEYASPVGEHASVDGDDNGYFWGRLAVGLD